MAEKTIAIDLEAYALLAAERRAGESFSQVIKRRLRPECTARALLEHLDEFGLAEDALDRVEELVRARAEHPARSAEFDTQD